MMNCTTPPAKQQNNKQKYNPPAYIEEHEVLLPQWALRGRVARQQLLHLQVSRVRLSHLLGKPVVIEKTPE
jgi:hypothetical protein